MPDEHESCNKYDRLSHTSALGELFIADGSKKAQEEIQKSRVFRNGNPSLAAAGRVCLHFSGRGFRAVDDSRQGCGTCGGDGLFIEVDVSKSVPGAARTMSPEAGAFASVFDRGLRGGNVDGGCGHRG